MTRDVTVSPYLQSTLSTKNGEWLFTFHVQQLIRHQKISSGDNRDFIPILHTKPVQSMLGTVTFPGRNIHGNYNLRHLA